MKVKKLIVSIAAFVAVFTGALLVGCNNHSPEESGGSSSDVTVSVGITLDRNSCTLGVGETTTLFPSVTGYEGNITWTTSDNSVVTVDGGKLTAQKQGTAVVKAIIDGAEAACTVTVTRASEVGTLTTDYSSLNLLVGKSVEVQASVTFDGTIVEGLSFEWNSENEAVASVVSEGDKASVSGLTSGSTFITVSCVHFGEILTETISVSVRNDVSLSVENLIPNEDGYALTLVKSEPSGYVGEEKREFSPVFAVTVDGKEIASPDVKVEIPAEAGSVVRYEEDTNKIVAVGVGETDISFVYETGGNRYAVTANICVILPEIVEEKVFDFEISEDYALISSALLPKNPDSARIDGEELAFSVSGEGIKIEGYKGIDFGKHTLTIEDENMSYRAEAFVVTSVIRNKEDLDAMAKEAEQGNGVWDGYFVLGNDIAYNGEFKTFCGLNHCAGWGGTTGFLGTFDGRGYIIEGLTIAADSEGRAYFGGLFGVIGSSGTVKNVGFVNSKIEASDASGIVADIVYGAIEDVFVEVDNQGGMRCAGIARYILSGGKLNRCMIFLSGAKEAAEGDFSGSNLALVSFSANEAKIDNCYSVGALELYRTGGDIPVAGSETDTLKSFSDYSEMKEYSFSLENWPEEIWIAEGGVPLFASYAKYVKSNIENLAIGNDETLPVSDILELDGSEMFVYTLKDEKEGISMEGNIITVEGCFGETFTVVATWIFDETVKSEKTFTIADKETISLNETFDIDLKNSRATISAEEFKGYQVISVKVDDLSLKFQQDEISLTLEGYSEIPYGEKQITIESDKATFKGKVLFATFISSTEEWDAEVAATAADPANWDKYYVLTANLDYTGKTYRTPKGEQYGAVSGFKGIFDGRNHKIIGVTLRGVGQSFFGTVALSGIIKNVAFIDCGLSFTEADGTTFISTNKSAIVADLLYGSVENIYLQYVNDGHWWTAGIAYFVYETASVKNCIAEVTGHVGDKLHSLFVICKVDAVISDCYAVTELEMPIACTGDDPAAGTAFVETENVRTFDSLEDMKKATPDLSGWNSDIWDISSGVPIFRENVEGTEE